MNNTEIVFRTPCGEASVATTVTLASGESRRDLIVRGLRENATEVDAEGCHDTAVEMRTLADRIEAHQ